VTRFRSFRNSDPPFLAELWNQAVPSSGCVRPVRVHELDSHALGTVLFDADGLIVAETDGRIVGFVHAGFGPELPVESTQPFDVCHEIGTISMLCVEARLDDPGLLAGLIDAAERYLRSRGAKVLYAGGLFPLNPFYWGIYGGSEGAGVLAGHDAFHRVLRASGYEPVSTTVLLEADLAVPEPRDPRVPLIRRQTRIEVFDDGTPVAGAQAWDMGWFGREDERTRIGLINLEVPPQYRRKGYGRFLVSEIFRRARENMVAAVAVATSSSNQPALALYASLGFYPIDESTLYRLATDGHERSGHA
jgi:ribosomal protein S18 acetylase RimI-like enzyme